MSSLVLFLTANVLFGAGLFAHAFLYNFYLGGLGHGAATMGAAAAAMTAGGLVALAPAGMLADRMGATRVYQLGCAIGASGLITGAALTQPTTLLIAAFVAGAGTACWRVAMGPLIMRLASGPARARIFSFNVALLVGSGAAWTAGAGALPLLLQNALGIDNLTAIRVCLAVSGVLTLAAALLVTRVRVPVPSHVPATALRSWRAAVPEASILLTVAAVIVWMCASGLIIPFMNIYFAREHQLPVARIGFIFAIAQAATAGFIVISGLLAARFGARRVLLLWMLLFAPALWALGMATFLPLAIALYFVQGLVAPATNPLIDEMLLDSVPAQRHGIVSSWRNAATELSGFLAALLGGVLLDRGSFVSLFHTAAFLALAGALALYACMRYVLSPRTETRNRAILNARST